MWAFLTDPGDVSCEEGWYQPAADWSGAVTGDVPHTWQEYNDLREYTGVVWYRRTIEVDENDLVGARAHLQFDVVDYETTVWMNGEELGTNRGGYLPFSFDVSVELSAGEY